MKKIDGQIAWQSTITNKASKYPGPSPEGSAIPDRLLPLASPIFPTFDTVQEASSQPSVFVTGTCIARNIEGALTKTSAKLLSRHPELQRDEGAGNLFGVLTKYNLPAILNEFIWALEPDRMPFSPGQFIEIAENEFVDLQTGGTEVRGDRDFMLTHRGYFNELFARAAKADLIIIPLAANEAWYDKEHEVYLNFRPARKMCIQNPGRFELRSLEFQDMKDCLADLHDLLRRHCKSDAKILYAVTPAATPLTYSGEDSIQASVYSKSMQNTVIHEFLRGLDDPLTAYLPLYDATILQDQRVNFVSQDYRHMGRHMSDRLIGMMMLALYPNNIEYAEIAAIGTCGCYSALNEFEKAFDVLNSEEFDGSTNARLLEDKAGAATRTNRVAQAIDLYVQAAHYDPSKSKYPKYALSMAIRHSSREHAEALIAKFEGLLAEHPDTNQKIKQELAEMPEDQLHALDKEYALRATSLYEHDGPKALIEIYDLRPSVVNYDPATGMLFAEALEENDRLEEASDVAFALSKRFTSRFRVMEDAMEYQVKSQNLARLHEIADIYEVAQPKRSGIIARLRRTATERIEQAKTGAQ